MGNYIASNVFDDNLFLEGFMISYMSSIGPTPYNMRMLPGGSLNKADDENVVRHKFKMALQHQRELAEALHGINNRLGRRLSPHILNELSLDEDVKKDKNIYSFTWVEKQRMRSRSRPAIKSGDEGLGTLGKLVPEGFSSEEILAFNCKKSQQQVPHRVKERRHRSRPERAMIHPAELKQRQIQSETKMTSLPQPSKKVEKETIQICGENRIKRTSWPPKEILIKVLKDEQNRPTTYFLGRFRKNSNSPFVECDYRLNKKDGNDSADLFHCKGDIQDLLGPEACIQYQVDKLNNNLDEKQFFLENLVYFFNNFEGRIWWNGYLITVEGPVESRIPLISIQMDPPTLTLDLKNLDKVAASRSGNLLTINGKMKGDEEDSAPLKTFRFKGQTAQDLKLIHFLHTPGSIVLGIAVPLLSRIPVSKSKNSLPLEQ